MTNWLTGWSYRKSHVITASSGAGANYQIKILVHSGSGTSTGNDVYLGDHCTSFPNDINLTDDSGDTPLSFWIEDLTADPITLWVKVVGDLSTVNKTIYIYYGKTGQSSLIDGDNTFVLFDDFIGTSIDTNLWEGDTAGTTVSGGIMTHTASDSGGPYFWLRSKNTFGPAVRYKANAQRYQQSYGGFDCRFGFDNDDDAHRAFWWSLQITNWRIACGSTGFTWSEPSIAQDTNYHNFQVFYISSSSIKYQLDDGTVLELTTDCPNIPLKIVDLVTYAYGACINKSKWVFISKYISPEPINSTWGSEETTSTNFTKTLTDIGGMKDTKFKGWGVTFTDKVGMKDTKNRLSGLIRYFTEKVGNKDTWFKGLSKHFTDKLGAKDSVHVNTKYKVYTDKAGYKDTKLKRKSLVRTFINKVGTVDTRSRLRHLVRTFLEKTGMYDKFIDGYYKWRWTFGEYPKARVRNESR